MSYKIYTLNHPITNEVRYIGYTVTSLEERLRGHIKDCNYKNKNSHKVKWIKKLITEGLKPTINLLENIETRKIAVFREIQLIFEYRLLGYNLVNGTDGGEGGTGYKFTEQQIKDKIARQTGRKLPPCSEERKLKISQANKGRLMTEEQRAKMTGLIRSEEHKIKLSKANKGRKLSDETKKLMGEARRKEWAEGIRVATRTGLKISEAQKDKMRGVNNPFFGKKHSEETMAKIKETWRKKREAKLLNKISDGL